MNVMNNLVALQQLLLSQNTPVVFNYGGIAFNLSATNKAISVVPVILGKQHGTMDIVIEAPLMKIVDFMSSATTWMDDSVHPVTSLFILNDIQKRLTQPTKGD